MGMVNSGTVQCKSPYPSQFGRLSAGVSSGPPVDSYYSLAFAV